MSKHGWHICLTFNPLQMNFSKITIRPKRPQKYINIFYPALCFASKHSSRQYRLEKTKKPLSGDVKKKKKKFTSEMEWKNIWTGRLPTGRSYQRQTDASPSLQDVGCSGVEKDWAWHKTKKAPSYRKKVFFSFIIIDKRLTLFIVCISVCLPLKKHRQNNNLSSVCSHASVASRTANDWEMSQTSEDPT